MALQDALGGLQEKLGANRIEVKHEGNSLQLAGVRVMEHDATPVMKEMTAEIGPGEHVLIEGKTPICHKLILAVAGLWPWGAGKVTLPAGANIFIATDRPYLPVGRFGRSRLLPADTWRVCAGRHQFGVASRRPGRLGRASWRGGELGCGVLRGATAKAQLCAHAASSARLDFPVGGNECARCSGPA